jgi:hypothetical protein
MPSGRARGLGVLEDGGEWVGGVLIVCYREYPKRGKRRRGGVGEKVPAGRMPPNYACGSAAAAAGTGRGYVCRWA